MTDMEILVAKRFDNDHLLSEDFIKAYVSDPGEMSESEAIRLAIARDQDAAENFLASVFDM